MKRSFLIIILLMIIVGQNHSQIVSQWRGENRTGVYNEENLLKKWPDEGPDSLWAVSGIGTGYSSASVTKDAIYVTGLFDTIEVVTAPKNELVGSGKSNTATIPQGFRGVGSITFKANINGEFSIKHADQIIRLDISLCDYYYY